MAEVFKAKSYGVEGFEKVIAIKRILPSMGEDRDFIKMFIDEAKIAGQLAHANICQIFELGRIEGAHFIAMEYIWGKDLLQIQNRYRKIGQIMPVPMACYVISRVCEGLDYAHRKKDAMGRDLSIVHRDCSPQNVLISYEGEVKIIDFGIAKASSRASRTMAGVLKGKFGYMSPEQVRGLPLDRRSDLFALGTVLYESLTGERLFMGESDFSTLEKVRNADVTPPSLLNRNIPEAVERIVMRSLTRDPEDRYQWCGEMRADLQKFLMTQPEVFTANTLASWLKQAFSKELGHERALMERYKTLGRDGLIQGKPQAEAKLDVVQYLGEAGDAEGDPTVLGGPSFDDIIEETPVPAAVPLRVAGKQRANDFEDEAPTELFGEIKDGDVVAEDDLDENRPTHDRLPPVRPRTAPLPAPAPLTAARGASGVVVQDMSSSGVHQAAEQQAMNAAAAQAQAMAARAGSSSEADIALNHFPTVPGAPIIAPAPTLPFGGDMAFGSTSSVTPLPVGADKLDASGKRKRPSVTKDVGIGIGIAILVLGLFAGGKWLFFGDGPGAREARASGMGTIAVAVPGTMRADVYVDNEKVGVVEGGEALTLDPRPVGEYTIRVKGPGDTGCEKAVVVEADRPSFVTCSFDHEPVTGRLSLKGITDEHTVLVDGQQISPEAAREALRLTPGEEHAIVVMRGTEVIKQLSPTVEAGQELFRDVSDAVATGATRGAPVAVKVAMADTSPAEKPGGDGVAKPPWLAGGLGARASAPEEKKPAPKPTRKVTKKGGSSFDSFVDKSATTKKKATTNTTKKKAATATTKKKATTNTTKKKAATDTTKKKATADTTKKKTVTKPAVDDGNAAQSGYLIANSTPWGARVYVDGKDSKMSTPIAKRRKISLKPGKHKVVFKLGKKKFTYSVVIEAGKIEKLVVALPVDGK